MPCRLRTRYLSVLKQRHRICVKFKCVTVKIYLLSRTTTLQKRLFMAYTENLKLFHSFVPFVVGLISRHLPFDLYTFFNRGHLLTITANRGPFVSLGYKSSVYTIHKPKYSYTFFQSRHIPPVMFIFGQFA